MCDKGLDRSEELEERTDELYDNLLCERWQRFMHALLCRDSIDEVYDELLRERWQRFMYALLYREVLIRQAYLPWM